MRVVFMGTPEFGATILGALLGSPHDIGGVVTRPDRPRGRGRRVEASPVAVLAASHSLPLIQPRSRGDELFLSQMKAWAPEATVVAAFGLILPQEILAVAPKGNINVHASLLPKYRGAAPVQDAIIKGESITGVTTMMMDEGLDTGDVLLRRETPIGAATTAGELEEQLACIGADLLLETLDALESGAVRPEPQDSAAATYSRALRPDDGDILWNQTAFETHNRIRGCTPRPGARLYFGGQPVRIWKATVDDCAQAQCAGLTPGTVLEYSKSGLRVVCESQTVLLVCEVQPAGRQRMPAADWARGARIQGRESRFDTARAG